MFKYSPQIGCPLTLSLYQRFSICGTRNPSQNILGGTRQATLLPDSHRLLTKKG